MNLFDVKDIEGAIKEISRFILGQDSQPVDWKNWYVGVTAEPSQRVYGEHKASRYQSVVVAVESEQAARSVERYFIEERGTLGNLVGGTHPRYVYAFRLDTLDEAKVLVGGPGNSLQSNRAAQFIGLQTASAEGAHDWESHSKAGTIYGDCSEGLRRRRDRRIGR